MLAHDAVVVVVVRRHQRDTVRQWPSGAVAMMMTTGSVVAGITVTGHRGGTVFVDRVVVTVVVVVMEQLMDQQPLKEKEQNKRESADRIAPRKRTAAARPGKWCRVE